MTNVENRPANTHRSRWLVAGGMLGAVLASSCCIVPLVLISLGISGAWIGQLTMLEPYKPLFLLVAIGFLAAGFWDVYFRKTRACEDGSVCARPHASVTKQAALWSGTLIVLAALTIDLWAPFFY
ncbi:mercuric transporter MerT family protein [Henriciella sp.]|uniref:mercuric transporter MerT family protein n=1 Tax=Henriciella sp. TaxID=1968823 RepID=UPI0026345BD0|nr:mercuric transporter MerT family protein [Henriciella sp.]